VRADALVEAPAAVFRLFAAHIKHCCGASLIVYMLRSARFESSLFFIGKQRHLTRIAAVDDTAYFLACRL